MSFKTFVEEFLPLAKKHELRVDGHYGIDKKSVLVRTMGKRRVEGRTDRQNKIWAGKPVAWQLSWLDSQATARFWSPIGFTPVSTTISAIVSTPRLQPYYYGGCPLLRREGIVTGGGQGQ